jgi:hypothetical protein
MRRSTLNFAVDLVSLIDLLALALSGFVMRYVLPPGSGGHGYRGGRAAAGIKHFWSMTRHQWADIHFFLAFLFVVLMAVHILMHWNWIKCYLKPRSGNRQ